MIFVFGAIGLLSMVANVVLYKRLNSVLEAMIELQTIEPVTEVEPERIAETPVPEAVKDIYLSRALPSLPKSTAGPLERPGGFV